MMSKLRGFTWRLPAIGGFVLTMFSACAVFESDSDLERKPKPAPKKVQRAARQEREAQPGETGKPLFDTVFHRGRPQKDAIPDFSGSNLSPAEQRLLRENYGGRAEDDPVIRQLRQQERKSQQQREDWVYGTKNGSYF